jgi:outer membrane biosynthesis protein TonB
MRILRILVMGVACVGATMGAQTPPSQDAPPQQTLPGKPVVVSSGVMVGRVVKKVMPDYPFLIRRMGIQGTVVMRAIIGKDGHIQKLEVLSGPKDLRGPATDAVKQWVYTPYLLDGKPVEIDTSVSVDFRINHH